jgi:hypothetical protein
MTNTLRYADSTQSVTAHHIRTWRRGEAHPIMSISSGPKDCISNDIVTGFEKTEAERISMYVARCTPFLIYHLPDGRAVDASKREVRIK